VAAESNTGLATTTFWRTTTTGTAPNAIQTFSGARFVGVTFNINVIKDLR
jgi:hypothetical protein